jgi:hypothetical protein
LALETPDSLKLVKVDRGKLAGGFPGSFDSGISSGDCGKSCFCGFPGLVSSRAQALK